MNSRSIDLIEKTLLLIEKGGDDFVDKIGEFKEKISDGVLKYNSIDKEITHFLVFEKDGKVDELSFYCKDMAFPLKEVEAMFGAPRQGYNFRENYTQFTFSRKSKVINDIYFIKDNKFEFNDDGSIFEITPRGKKSNHSEVAFNAFCLKVVDNKI